MFFKTRERQFVINQTLCCQQRPDQTLFHPGIDDVAPTLGLPGLKIFHHNQPDSLSPSLPPVWDSWWRCRCPTCSPRAGWSCDPRSCTWSGWRCCTGGCSRGNHLSWRVGSKIWTQSLWHKTVAITLDRTPEIGWFVHPDDEGVPVGDEHPLPDVELGVVDEHGPLYVLLHHVPATHRTASDNTTKIWPKGHNNFFSSLTEYLIDCHFSL